MLYYSHPMGQKNIEKNKPEMDFSIYPILVVNDSKLKPYIESFSYSPSNVIQQPLGNLLGFLKISDTSEDSAYIVNFLASVLKKEYYINPRRSVEESLDQTLHKVNVALSEIAKNGNVNWLGTLDCAICVLEKNDFHFSVSGKGKILLLRGDVITDISEGLASADEDPHPIKTFVNVSSGLIKIGDKILVTSNDIFRVFSLSEIKKNALRFSNDKFVQFLHTALVNELELAETIIIDIIEPKKTEIKSIEQKEAPKELSNVFSEKAFKEPAHPQPHSKKTEKNKEDTDFVDEKTGHIYIQEEKRAAHRRNNASLYWFIIKERLTEAFFLLREKIQKSLHSIKQKIKSRSRKNLPADDSARNLTSDLQSKPAFSFPKISLPKIKIGNFSPRLIKFVPDFSKIKALFSRLSYPQKVYGLIIIIAIIFIPLIFVRLTNKNPGQPVTQEIAKPQDPREILAGEKNISLSLEASVIFSEASISNIQAADGNLLMIAPQKIFIRGGKETKEFPLPQNSGNIVLTAEMKDLNLLFLLTDQKKLFSFSPVSREFKENSIAIPDNSKIRAMATYLTYLYLFDGANNQIYRYPRAEGGFGQIGNWLKEDLNLEKIMDAAIDENIFLVDGDSIIKLFRGKKQELAFEQSATPINFDRIFTDSDIDSLYVLDSGNSRIVLFGKDGLIRTQYYHELLKNASAFSVDLQNNKAYFVTADKGVAVLSL